MSKVAVSLISIEPASSRKSTWVGGLAALVYDSLGDLLSQVETSEHPILLNRAANSQEVLALVAESETALIITEVSEPTHAFHLLVSLKLLKERIATGQVRVIVNCALPSLTLQEKLKNYGCIDVTPGLHESEDIVQKARMLVELLLFRRTVARIPGRQVTSIGLACLLSEWISDQGVDYPSIAHLFSACLSAACDGARVEFFHRPAGAWACAGTSDFGSAKWLEKIETAAKKTSQGPGGTDLDDSEVRIEWIGNQAGALVCHAKKEITEEQGRLLHAAAELSRDFVMFDQVSSDFKSVELSH